MKSSTVGQLSEQLGELREALCRLEAGMAQHERASLAAAAGPAPPPWAAGLEGLGQRLGAAAEQQRQLVGEIAAAKRDLATVGQTVTSRLEDVSAALIGQLQGVARRVEETGTELGSQDHALAMRLNEVATALAAQDQALVRRLDETGSALSAQLQALVARLDAESAGSAADRQGLEQRIADEVGAVSQRLEAAVAAAAGSGEALAQRLAETGAALSGQIAAATQAAAANDAQLRRLEEADTTLAARLQAVSQHVTAASAIWSATEQALDQHIANVRRSVEAGSEALAQHVEEARMASASTQTDLGALRSRLGEAALAWEGGHQALEHSLFSLRRELKDKAAEEAALAARLDGLGGHLDGLGGRLDEASAAWREERAALEGSLGVLAAELAEDRRGAGIVAARLEAVETLSAALAEGQCRIAEDLAAERRASEELGEELRALHRNLEAAAAWLFAELESRKKSPWGFLSRWLAGGGKSVRPPPAPAQGR